MYSRVGLVTFRDINIGQMTNVTNATINVTSIKEAEIQYGVTYLCSGLSISFLIVAKIHNSFLSSTSNAQCGGRGHFNWWEGVISNLIFLQGRVWKLIWIWCTRCSSFETIFIGAHMVGGNGARSEGWKSLQIYIRNPALKPSLRNMWRSNPRRCRHSVRRDRSRDVRWIKRHTSWRRWSISTRDTNVNISVQFGH